MSRHPSNEILSARVDGELCEEERQSTDAHMKTCVSCRKKDMALRALNESVNHKTALPGAPHHLRLQVEKILRAKFDKRSPLRRLAAAVVLAVGLGAGALFLHPGHRPPKPLSMAMLFQDHDEHLHAQAPWDVSAGDPKALQTWVSTQLHRDVRLPRFEHARLLGGRVCRSFPKATVQAFYKTEDGERLSLFLVRDDAGNLRNVSPSTSDEDSSVACWRDGVFYALVKERGLPWTENLCERL